MTEDDSCYRMGQQEMHFPPFPNGELNCGIAIRGAVTAPPSTVDTSNNAYETSLRVATIAKKTLQQSGLAFTQDNTPNRTGPGPNGNASHSDTYHLYDQTVRCDLYANTQNSLVKEENSGLIIQPGQLAVTFDCYQSASKNFFKYVPSALD